MFGYRLMIIRSTYLQADAKQVLQIMISFITIQRPNRHSKRGPLSWVYVGECTHTQRYFKVYGYTKQGSFIWPILFSKITLRAMKIAPNVVHNTHLCSTLHRLIHLSPHPLPHFHPFPSSPPTTLKPGHPISSSNPHIHLAQSHSSSPTSVPDDPISDPSRRHLLGYRLRPPLVHWSWQVQERVPTCGWSGRRRTRWRRRGGVQAYFLELAVWLYLWFWWGLWGCLRVLTCEVFSWSRMPGLSWRVLGAVDIVSGCAVSCSNLEERIGNISG